MNTSSPKVSLIIPIYNTGKLLVKCLDSIKSQTILNQIEIILVNDGSTDNSKEICSDYIQGDKRFILINQNNQGVSTARNVGLQKASGEYICFIDSDDWIENEFCELMLKEIETKKTDLVISGYKIYHSKLPLKYTASKIDKKNISRKEIIKSLKNYMDNPENPLGNTVWAKLFRRDIIIKNNIKFVKNLRIGEDLLFVLSYQKHVENVTTIPNLIYCLNRTNNLSVTSSYVKNYYDDLVVVKQLTYEINKDLVDYTEEFKAYQYFRVAAKAINEEGKINNGKSFYLKYKSIRELCNKKEVRKYCDNYQLKNENERYYRIIKKLIKLNQPMVILVFITLSQKFKLI